MSADHVVTKDETPTKAGPVGAGEIEASHFWSMHGELDELRFGHFELWRLGRR